MSQKNMGIQWRIRYRLCYELACLIPNFKSLNIIMSARIYFMKRVIDWKDVLLPQDNSEDRQVYSVCILQFSCFTKYIRMQSKHKQTNCEHSRRKTLKECFLSRYHYTKSKNYFKRRCRIRHWIPMFIGTLYLN